MTVKSGDRFVALTSFETPAGVPKSRYMEGHGYAVTDQNADFVQAQIDAGLARPGDVEAPTGVRLGAAPAVISGVAVIKP